MISVLILTKNEQQDLPGCLKSVAWSDDVHVYDSMSTDATVEIAAAFGAHVTKRPFDNWASHQNWGLANVPFRHEWVFYIDADERMTPELVRAVQAAAANAGDKVAFRVQRRDFLMGQWLRHVQTSPFYMRLFRPSKMRYERLVNPVSIADGPVGEAGGYLDHYPFSKGLSHWIDRHNQYSGFEARQIVENRRASAFGGAGFSLSKAFFAKDFHEKRFHQKELFYRLPARPLLKFAILYLAKRGFLDGRAGLAYAALQSIYEYFIVLKVRELERGAPAVPQAAQPAATPSPAPPPTARNPVSE
jgi:glycosyltransferase involved in cell wall biosynthesis